MQTAFPLPEQAAPSASSRAPRLTWIDNLRTFIILLVVNMHACVTYSHVGSWYITEEPEPPMPVKMTFLFWQGHLQAFFMGLLFFISGVFAQKSLQRRGPSDFLRERAIRLCLPALFYMLVIHPLIVFGILGRGEPVLVPLRYFSYITAGRFLSGNGPLWFTLALFLFSVCFAAVKKLRPPKSSAERSAPAMFELPPLL
jgi:fucose 4-O-acetylase-like acetyltransferase